MKRNTERILLLFTACFVIACSPFPNIEALVPPVGKVGDVIDIRDSNGASLTPEGIVYFGNVVAPQVLLWTSEDVFLQVPSGTTSTVPVIISIDGSLTNVRSFSLLEDVDLSRIACFGDSIFHWGVPPILQDFIDQDEDLTTLDLIVLDQARNGEKLTGDGTWTRWQNVLNLITPDLVILLEGTNDVSDSSNALMADIQQSLTNMLDEALRTGVVPVLCTLLPRVGSCGDSESPTTEEFNDWLKSYADGISIPVVDFYEDFLSTPDWQNVYFTTNCLHPNTNGRQRIAELLRDQIREVYLPPCTDLDEDGYGDPYSPTCPYAGADCDDSDPNVHPDATEDCLNGIDDDCDTYVDFADSDCPCWDADEDLFDDQACGGTDCDDSNPNVNPDATEDCFNGIDDDCDTYVDFDDSDCPCWDADEDLFDDQACGGTDCDDSNPDVNPGMNEAPFGDPICNDEIDNDCDGDTDALDLGCME